MASIEFVPKVYSGVDMQSVVDRSFQEFGQEETGSVSQSLESFFEEYESLFYTIPATGSVNSHEYLVKKSSEIYTPDQTSVDIQPLLDEITLLRSQSIADTQEIISLRSELTSLKASATGSSI